MKNKGFQGKAPLFDKMLEHRSQKRASFHVPGHKNGRGLNPTDYESLHSIMSLDFTELPSLDDLHHPSSIIKEAQLLAAECFVAEQTYFLVNGSTVGNLAMILTVCSPGDLIIVQRNVHKSIINGLMLAGAKAVFLPPRWDLDSKLATGVSLTDITIAMNDHPTAKAVLLSNPNYYGMGIELTDIANKVHSKGMPLLVDEAHAAHYGFHPLLPKSAIACGADIVVQSTHKMLTALTMGAMLHVQGNRIDRDIIQQRLGMLQSSSPSYPIMASLDLCRRWMYQSGEQSINEGILIVQKLREQIKENLPSISIVEKRMDNPAYDSLDPFKLTLSDRSGTWSGYELRDKLEQAGCDAEMAEADHVLLHFSLASEEKDAKRLFLVLSDIFAPMNLEKQDFLREIANNTSKPIFSHISAPIEMTLPQKFDPLRVKAVPIDQAVGFISAEMVVPYPPGIPLLYVGEEITEEAVNQISRFARQGATFQGTINAQSLNISVFR